ncbi:GNAT family N-acetyltransferase [Devosia sp. FKR38]|uniref:GNAT family N-acetyltransferase n=1 Tax=Devosia sp. FKR38 TaxID=2562312 RepID=UPI0010C10820|nr:GNAT family N-acetyltransferase [Devosia sp. FKR38]
MSDAIILQTERLALAPWRADQLDDLVALQSDLKVARFYDIAGVPWTREKCETRLSNWLMEWTEHGLGKHRLVRRSDGRFVGRAGFSIHARTGEPELGYGLASEFWGLGYATEIAAALRDWYFATRTDEHFIAFAHRDNTASRHVLEKIGMTPTYAMQFADMPHQFYQYKRAAS